MFDRWRQENFLKYLCQEYALDALVEHATVPDDPTREVPNPAWAALDVQLHQAQAQLDEDNARLAVAEACLDAKLWGQARKLLLAIAEERPIVIFPQGTRVAPGHHRAYKMGTAVLYAELGLPIVPMALDSGLYWPKHGPKRGGTVTFSFLPPIAPGLRQEQALATLEQRLEGETDRLLALHSVRPSGTAAA